MRTASLPHATDCSTCLCLNRLPRLGLLHDRSANTLTSMLPPHSDGKAHDNGRPGQAVLGRSFRHARMENQ
jgi:hypothetical protein